jgi:TolB-like protein
LASTACAHHHATVREEAETPVVVVPAAPPFTGYARGSDDPTMDRPAMSVGLDRVDLDRLLRQNLASLAASPAMQAWQGDAARGSGDRIAVLSFDNESGLPVDESLEALLSETETWLVTNHAGAVVAHDRQPQMIQEVRRQQSDAFDPSQVAVYGRQLGAQYFVTGKVQAVAESAEGADRVQYTLTMQVIDVQTSGVLWQHTSHVTKLHA